MSDTFDYDAIKELAEKLGKTDEEIKAAIRVSWIYDSHVKRHKSIRNKHRAEVVQKDTLERLKVERPDDCFCVEDGFVVNRGMEHDGIIGNYTAYSWSDWDHLSPYQKPIYKCSRCGKGYTIEVAIG